LQIGHQRLEVAFQHHAAALGQREQVVPAGIGHRLPEPPPSLGTAAHGEAPRAHDERPAHERGDPPGRDCHVERDGADADLETRIEECTAPDEVGIAVEQPRQLLESRRQPLIVEIAWHVLLVSARLTRRALYRGRPIPRNAPA
jgi:hypothetical protein